MDSFSTPDTHRWVDRPDAARSTPAGFAGDRQEHVIPIKDLIIGRLVNWNLRHTTNRIVINVGIAYGTGTEKACGLFRCVRHDHEWIADDPGLVVTSEVFEGFEGFDGFGD